MPSDDSSVRDALNHQSLQVKPGRPRPATDDRGAAFGEHLQTQPVHDFIVFLLRTQR